MYIPTSKNQNPREGIERVTALTLILTSYFVASKNQNPREGIESHASSSGDRSRMSIASKNQNPREGIESQSKEFRSINTAETSKNQNPREGIETLFPPARTPGAAPCLQKTKIPARGLKRISGEIRSKLTMFASKNQNPREGIETYLPSIILLDNLCTAFKKPKSPRGD